MKLFSGKVGSLSAEIVQTLADSGDIEVEDRKEVALDVESVFKSYIDTERAASDKAKELLQTRGLPQSEYSRLRRLAAEQKGIKVGDETLDFLLDQLIEMLMHSDNVAEVFVQDHDLRRRMRPLIKKYMDVEEALDAEVRGQIKHVQEGTRTWEIEYQRVLGDIQRRKGLR